MDIKLKTQFNNPRLPLIPIPGFHDDFNRPAADTLGSTVDGKPWQEYLSNSSFTWVINADGTAGYPNSTGNASAAVVDALTADGTLTTKLANVNPANTQAGLCARFRDADNYLWIAGGSSGGPLRIYLRAGGSSSLVANSSHVPVTGDVIAVTLAGPAVTVAVNGTQALSANVPEYATETRHGLFAVAAGDTRWDYVTFTPAG